MVLKTVPFGILLAALVTLEAMPVAAQPDAETDQAGSNRRDLEPIAVTGSRIRSLIDDQALPLTRIERGDLMASGQNSLGEFLQQLPFSGGSPLNTRTSQRGRGGELSRGIETIELRGLGPERTLVLVNGRRFVPGGNGGGGVVDLGMIPLAMIERIEIYRAGASVEYGADAVAGVINILTREDFDGVELSARGSISSRGDGESTRVSGLVGHQGGRGGIVAGLEYTDQPSLGKGERAFSRVRQSLAGPDNQRVFDGSSAPPGGQFRTSLGRLTLIDGRPGTSPDDFRQFIDQGEATDRYNFNPFEDLVQESRRLVLFGQGHWRLNRSIEMNAEAFLHRRESSQQLAPLPLFTTREQDVVVAADNVFNPFGEALVDVRRRLVEAGPRRFAQSNRTWRLAAGLSGGLGRWFWDASVAHGRNETDQSQTGDLLDNRLRAALGPSFIDPSGQPSCGTEDQPIPGCVPLNLFGGPGSITPAMLDYVGTDLTDRGFNEQTVAELNLSGDLVALPAGPMAAAAGLQWRREQGADRPDPETRAGNTTGNARAATRGAFDSGEVYVELGIPLTPRLELDLGARAVRFSNFGTEGVFETGAAWRPMPSLTISGQFAQAFRAPGIGELFGGQTQSNPIVLDPCARFDQRTPIEIERCIAQGVPADGSFDQTGEETPELAGGNPALEPERADLLTLGARWQIPWLDQARMRLDYYDITIDDGIGALGANTILGQCLATGADRFCDAIQRSDRGAIESIAATRQNLARESARGLDLELDWNHAAGVGRLNHRLLLSHVLQRRLTAFPGAEPLFGAGSHDPDRFGAIPAWRAVYALGWTGARFSAGYRAHWIDALRQTGGEVFPGTSNRVGSVVYHDLNLAWHPAPRWQVSAGIDNLTDVQPPFVANADAANTDLATYRALGTAFWLRLGWRTPDR